MIMVLFGDMHNIMASPPLYLIGRNHLTLQHILLFLKGCSPKEMMQSL